MTLKTIKILGSLLLLMVSTRPVYAGNRIPITVSILPQKYFVQQIGRERVAVQVMVSPGANPATYEPKPLQMASLAKTRIYFAIGVFFEKIWLPKFAAANPQMDIVHTERGIDKIPMTTHFDPAAHLQARQSSTDTTAGLDPHIWLAPPLVKRQAHSIFEALAGIDPVHEGTYAANYRNFIARIDALHADLSRTFAGKQGLRFMVFHPAWGYFARTYGLVQVPIELAGKSPKPAQLKKLVKFARHENIKVIFIQPQFSARSARLIAGEIGGQVVVADPLAAGWMTNLQKIAGRFTAALR